MGENHVNLTKEYYDSEAANSFYSLVWGGDDIHVGVYDNFSITVKSASRNTVKLIISLLPYLDGNTKILDLGAGYGGAARYLAWHYGCKVDCLNLSEKQNAVNEKKTQLAGLDQLVKIYPGEIENLPFENESYDIVLSIDSLLHVQDRDKAFDEISRVLKSKGWLVFSDVFQGENVPKVALKSLIERIPIDSLGKVQSYQEMLENKGFVLNDHKELTPQLVKHYSMILSGVKDQKAQLVQKAGGDFVKQTMKGLNQWIRAAKKEQLTWGIMLYQKV